MDWWVISLPSTLIDLMIGLHRLSNLLHFQQLIATATEERAWLFLNLARNALEAIGDSGRITIQLLSPSSPASSRLFLPFPPSPSAALDEASIP